MNAVASASPEGREAVHALGKAEDENARDYIQFDVVSEPWNRYRLSDGSFLRIRFVLLKMRRAPSPDPSKPHGATMSSQVLVVVEPPAKYRGKPGGSLTPAEVEASIEGEPAVEVIADPPSVYRFEGDRKLIVNTRVLRVQRSSKFGPDGERLYAVGTASEVAVMGGPTGAQADISEQPKVRARPKRPE